MPTISNRCTGYELVWSLIENGKPVGKGGSIANLNALARQKQQLAIPYELPAAAKPNAEYFLNLSVRLKEATRWAPKGHEIAWHQVPVVKPAAPRQTSAYTVNARFALRRSPPHAYRFPDRILQWFSIKRRPYDFFQKQKGRNARKRPVCQLLARADR